MDKADFSRELGTIIFKHTSTQELPVERVVELAFKITDDILEQVCKLVKPIELATHYVRDNCNSCIDKRLDAYLKGVKDTLKEIKGK